MWGVPYSSCRADFESSVRAKQKEQAKLREEVEELRVGGFEWCITIVTPTVDILDERQRSRRTAAAQKQSNGEDS